MSKRYGRNQRRNHREQTVSLQKSNDMLLRAAGQENKGRIRAEAALRRAQNEIAEMVKVLRPVTEVTRGVRPIMNVSTQLTFTRPSPKAAYKMDLEKLVILKGPEAQAALAFEIGKEIAEFFSRYGR